MSRKTPKQGEHTRAHTHTPSLNLWPYILKGTSARSMRRWDARSCGSFHHSMNSRPGIRVEVLFLSYICILGFKVGCGEAAHLKLHVVGLGLSKTGEVVAGKVCTMGCIAPNLSLRGYARLRRRLLLGLLRLLPPPYPGQNQCANYHLHLNIQESQTKGTIFAPCLVQTLQI